LLFAGLKMKTKAGSIPVCSTMHLFFPKRRSRHIRSQMKFFSGSRFKVQAANAQWGFANKLATKYRSNGLFGMN